jgi:DNA adenine methylase
MDSFLASQSITPPIKRHGGKHYLAKRIILLMPPHVHYVEPFFGAGGVLLHKDPEGVSEVVNDIDGELICFWRALQSEEQFARLQRRIEATPFAQQVFDSALETDGSAIEDPIERAARFFILARQSRQGIGRVFATLSRQRTRRGMNEQVASWLGAIEGLPEVHQRLKRIAILNDDAVKVIRTQDGKDTLFYCDPPYVHTTRTAIAAYNCEMDDHQHVELLKELAAVEGKFILSGYRCRLYDDWAAEHRFQRVDIPIDNKASSAKTKEIKLECLWMNYNPDSAQVAVATDTSAKRRLFADDPD